MAETDLQQLFCEIRDQLNRNGLPSDMPREQAVVLKPDIDAIRMTIEREEKIYPLLSLALSA